MGFDKKNIGMRDDYFVATSNRSQGDQAYDDDGLPIYAEQTSIEFWGSVQDLPSIRTDYMDRYRMVQVKRIICDARDIELIDEDYTIVRDGEDEKYQIVDVIQTSFKFTAELIIERII
jgi:hypothetical protein